MRFETERGRALVSRPKDANAMAAARGAAAEAGGFRGSQPAVRDTDVGWDRARPRRASLLADGVWRSTLSGPRAGDRQRPARRRVHRGTGPVLRAGPKSGPRELVSSHGRMSRALRGRAPSRVTATGARSLQARWALRRANSGGGRGVPTRAAPVNLRGTLDRDLTLGVGGGGSGRNVEGRPFVFLVQRTNLRPMAARPRGQKARRTGVLHVP